MDTVASVRRGLSVAQDAWKWCWVCRQVRPPTAFYVDRSHADGLSTRCKVCCDDRQRARPRKPPRSCKRCGAPTPSGRHHYCTACGEWARLRRQKRAKNKARPPGFTTATGYGYRHQQLRKEWEPKVAAGGVACWRCRRLIVPGSSWDLGHDDHDRGTYRGPEHSRCNRATAGRKKQRSAFQVARANWW